MVVSRVWSKWADSLAIVRPSTVIAWHRRGFALFWAWKSRRVGRPPLAAELVRLIERISRENPDPTYNGPRDEGRVEAVPISVVCISTTNARARREQYNQSGRSGRG